MKRILLLTIACLFLAAAQAGAQTKPVRMSGSTALEGSHTFSAGLTLYGISVVWHTSAARWLMLFDAASVPADGAVVPVYCAPLQGAASATDGMQAFDFTAHPMWFSTGIVVVASTSATGCFNKAVDGSNDAFFAQVSP